MRRNMVLLFTLILITSFTLHAQSSWEGNAVVGQLGEFPEEGLYAASNSFPQNQLIEVTNLETGETAEMIITKRVDEPGIFLVVSSDAARRLGMSRGEPARVRAKPAGAAADTVTPGSERALSPDPDVNPSAALTEEELYPAPVAEAEEEEPAAEEPAPEPEPAAEPEPEPEVAAPRSGVLGGAHSTAARLADPRRAPDIGTAEAPPAIAAEPEPTATPAPEGNEVERALETVRSRVAGRDMFPPPRETGVATFLTPPPRREETLGLEGRTVEAPEPPRRAPGEGPAAEYLGRLSRPADDVTADLPPADAEAPVAEAGPEAGLPPAVRREDERRAAEEAEEPEDLDLPTEPPPEDAVITLEPAEERPPEKPETEPAEEAEVAEAPTEPAPAAEEAPAEREAELPVVTDLDPERYYLQVGAYSTPTSARAAIDRLGGYPTEVLADGGGDDRTMYRVLVGPLNEDERGSVLYLVRAMGYADAFIRRADG